MYEVLKLFITSFGTRKQLISKLQQNPFPGGVVLSLLVSSFHRMENLHFMSLFDRQYNSMKVNEFSRIRRFILTKTKSTRFNNNYGKFSIMNN